MGFLFVLFLLSHFYSQILMRDDVGFPSVRNIVAWHVTWLKIGDFCFTLVFDL